MLRFVWPAFRALDWAGSCYCGNLLHIFKKTDEERRSFVVVCALFLTIEALGGLGISVRAQSTDQDWEKAVVSLIGPGTFGGLRTTASQEQAGPAESQATMEVIRANPPRR